MQELNPHKPAKQPANMTPQYLHTIPYTGWKIDAFNGRTSYLTLLVSVDHDTPP